MKTSVKDNAPLYMTYTEALREVHVSSQVAAAIRQIAKKINHLPEEVAAAWLEHMCELHGFSLHKTYEKQTR